MDRILGCLRGNISEYQSFTRGKQIQLSEDSNFMEMPAKLFLDFNLPRTIITLLLIYRRKDMGKNRSWLMPATQN